MIPASILRSTVVRIAAIALGAAMLASLAAVWGVVPAAIGPWGHSVAAAMHDPYGPLRGQARD